jgi:polysaccharide biosynthesis protein PslL
LTSHNNRHIWIDICKGLGIFFVVLGHSGNVLISHFLFWFHMPLFFILSGYLHKQSESLNDLFSIILKRTFQLLIPYFSFYLLILILFQFDANKPILITKVDIERVIDGGQLLTGFFGPFWFITTLYITQITFLIVSSINNHKIIIIIVFLLYILSHVELPYTPSKDTGYFWNVDVVLFAIAFYSFGYYLKKYKKLLLNSYIFILCSFISTFFIVLNVLNIIDYTLDMKYKIYNHFFLDLIVPISFSMTIIFFARQISNFIIGKTIAYIGAFSLTIMYLHIPVNLMLDNFFKYDYYVFTIVGIILPILLTILIFDRFHYTRIAFLGIVSRKIMKPKVILNFEHHNIDVTNKNNLL